MARSCPNPCAAIAAILAIAAAVTVPGCATLGPGTLGKNRERRLAVVSPGDPPARRAAPGRVTGLGTFGATDSDTRAARAGIAPDVPVTTPHVIKASTFEGDTTLQNAVAVPPQVDRSVKRTGGPDDSPPMPRGGDNVIEGTADDGSGPRTPSRPPRVKNAKKSGSSRDRDDIADDAPWAEGNGSGFPDEIRLGQADGARRPGRSTGTADDEDVIYGENDADQPDTNLGRSRAGRRGEGGGPTRAEDDENGNDEDEFKSDLLEKALGLEDSPIGVFGWLQMSYTGNQYHPKDGLNFGVNPNQYANQFLFQQLWFTIEKRIDMKRSDEYQWGFRTDNLTGSDWNQYNMVGLFDQAFSSKYFGYDPVQFYGEVHLPWLTEGGIDVKGGRFFTLVGYEDAAAPGRPLNSATYSFGYGQPFTHFGVMTTLHVSDRLNVYNGIINGWDRWINENYRWGYTGGIVWDSPDERTNVSLSMITGPNQFPSYFPAGYKNEPNGVPPPPFLAGRRNLLYNKNNAVYFSQVLIHQATEELTLIGEASQAYETNIPYFGPGGSYTNAGWYGVAGFMLYEFNEKWTGVLRGDVFRDQHGVRTGFNNTFYETTLGLIYKPKSWFWIRPEIRWDWTTGEPAYNDATAKHQFTYGFDMIFLF